MQNTRLFPHAQSELAIAGTTLKNRIVHAPIATSMDGTINDQLIRFHQARARGGIGLSILEIVSVHPSTPVGLQPWAGDLSAGYARLMDAVRPYGMRIFQQLWYGGFNSAFSAAALAAPAPWSASSLPGYSPLTGQAGVVAQAMTRSQIREVVDGFAEAALRAKDGGIDGVEVHAAHTYAVQQFMSPLWNHRQDEYGGSIENRLRFAIEILTAIRAAVGPAYPVGIRLSPEHTPGGLTAVDLADIVRRLEAAVQLDFIDLSSGGYVAFPNIMLGLPAPAGYQADVAAIVSAATTKPVIAVGRFRSLAEAEQVIASGTASLVAFGRQLLADPELVNKSLAGDSAAVRPCIACNQGCIGSQLGPYYRLGCTVNPVALAGTPERDLDPAPAPRRVIVIGGGPAGMEAARVAALRGHAVTLIEQSGQLGGTLRQAARAPGRAPFFDFIAWQEGELARSGVTVRFNETVTEENLASLSADAIVFATGAKVDSSGRLIYRPGILVEGMHDAAVHSSRTILSGDWAPPPNARTALVYDDVGHYEAAAVAEELQRLGLGVTFATHHASFIPLLEPAQIAGPTLARLRDGGMSFVPRALPVRIANGRCELNYLGSQRGQDIAADVVVLVTQTQPDRGLASAVAGHIETHFVGDALTTRFLDGAVASGQDVGRRL